MIFGIIILSVVLVVGFLLFKYKFKSSKNSDTITIDGVEYKEYDDC